MTGHQRAKNDGEGDKVSLPRSADDCESKNSADLPRCLGCLELDFLSTSIIPRPVVYSPILPGNPPEMHTERIGNQKEG